MAVEEFEFVTSVLDKIEEKFESGPAASHVIASNLEGRNARLRSLVECCDTSKDYWLGSGNVESSLVEQWMAFKSTEFETQEKAKQALEDLNSFLASKSFLAALAHPTLADLCVFWAAKNFVKSEMVKTLPNLCRWFDQMQRSQGVRESLAAAKVARVTFQFPDAWSLLGKAQLIHDSSSTSPSSTTSTIPVDKKKGNTDQKNNKKEKSSDNKKDDKKKKKESQPVAESAGSDQPEVTKLDIRVGKIVKCWKHETADKLFCEEIDVGEEEPRKIASGLVGFYNDASELADRKVLVMCNLKPKNLAGYKSHGMVLCASTADKSKVELVDPPADAAIGERISFAGIEGGPYEPFVPNQVAKKKVFENVAPNLKTNDARQPLWVGPDGKEHLFMTSAGACSVPTIAKGNVS